MNFRIGDRVKIVNKGRLSHDTLGNIIKRFTEHDGYDWVVRLDRRPEHTYNRELAYLERELELDKNTIVRNILSDL